MLGMSQCSRGAGVSSVAKTGISILLSTSDSVFCSMIYSIPSQIASTDFHKRTHSLKFTDRACI